ncbi:hypothetical protein [Propionivibrio limicola]|uniref:hypothetical protein n=1 Tax=Propionivibrio limicola TaxID=167645 RepID=UPI0012917305|nr:hypothetical protein [Propionivibrio limicola]
MTKVIELLDAVKKAKGIETNYALAKALELPTQRISDYYKGNRFPDATACLQIAKALGMEFGRVSAIVQLEAEKDEKKRGLWEDYFKSIGGYAASIALATIVTSIMTPSPAEAAPTIKSIENDLYYVKLQNESRIG